MPKTAPLPTPEEQLKTKAQIHWERGLHGCHERFETLERYTAHIIALNKNEDERQAALAKREARL